MSLTEESVKELRKILRKDLNKRVSTKQARKFGEWILKFYSDLDQSKNSTTNNNNK